MDFEDIIYIVIAIGWGIFSFLKKTQKNRDRANRNHPHTQSKRKPDFQSDLEEWLREISGEQASAKTTHSQNTSSQTKTVSQRKEETQKKPVLEAEWNQYNTEKRPKKVDNHQQGSILEPSINSPIDEQEEHINSEFDLRQAVIHSVILNRPDY